MKNTLLPALLALLAAAPVLAQEAAQVRSVDAFHAIQVGGGIALEVNAGPAQRVEVRASTTELRDHILTTVAGGVLTIRFDNSGSRGRRQQNTQLRVLVTADQLTALTASSGSAVTARGDFAAPSEFQLDVSSGSALRADIKTGTLAVREASGSTVSLGGQASSLDLRVGGGSVFTGKNLQTSKCRVAANGGSSAQLAVKDDLVAEADGGSTVSYSGSPQVTKRASGGSSISGR